MTIRVTHIYHRIDGEWHLVPVRPAEVRPAEVRFFEFRIGEVRPSEVRTDVGVLLTPRVPGSPA
jgi:hypothetical protein